MFWHVARGERIAQSRLSYLTRKVLRLDPVIIIGFSGSSGPAVNCAREIKRFWSDLPPKERSFETATQRIRGESFAEVQTPKLRFTGLGVYLKRVEATKPQPCFVAHNGARALETVNFGTCYAIGSGTDNLFEFLRRMDPNVAEWRKGPSSSQEIEQESQLSVQEMIGALNNRQFFLGHANAFEPSWGEHLEAFYLDPGEMIWKSHGSSAHLFIRLLGTRDEPRVMMIGSPFCHDDRFGLEKSFAILPEQFRGAQDLAAFVWSIGDLGQPPRPAHPDQLMGFDAETLSITVQYWDAKRFIIDNRHFSFRRNRAAPFVARYDANGADLTIPKAIYSHMIDKICSDCEMDELSDIRHHQPTR